jgi:hypothetical protein
MSFSVDVSNALKVKTSTATRYCGERNIPGGFIEQQNGGILQQSSGNRNALFFASTQPYAAFANFGIIT